MHTLETIHISSDINKVDARFPVQTIIRPQNVSHRDYRGYAGRIASGVFRLGDEVTIMPSGWISIDREFRVEDAIDISRGNMIVRTNNKPNISQDIEVMLCWLHNDKAKPRTKYSIMHTSNEQKAIIKEIIYKIDINSLTRNNNDNELQMNDISKVKIRTTKPLMVDSYRENRTTGSFVLVDEMTNETVAAGMIV